MSENPNTLIHKDQGGAVETFESGAVLNIKAGAEFQMDGTDISTPLGDIANIATQIEAALEGMTEAGAAMISAETAAAQLALLTDALKADLDPLADLTAAGVAMLQAASAAAQLGLLTDATKAELDLVHGITAAGGAILIAANAAAQLALMTVATKAEIETRCDDSAMEQTITAAGALSTTVAVSKLAVVSGGAVTLAAPTKPGMQKIIKMTTDDGDVTLALTNVVGGTQSSTATFGAVGDTLVLMSDVASGGKWMVIKEIGVVLT
jgi:hypothetical protein